MWLSQPLQSPVLLSTCNSVWLSQPLYPLQPRDWQFVSVSASLSQPLQPLQPRVWQISCICLYITLTTTATKGLADRICLCLTLATTATTANTATKGLAVRTLYVSASLSQPLQPKHSWPIRNNVLKTKKIFISTNPINQQPMKLMQPLQRK